MSYQNTTPITPTMSSTNSEQTVPTVNNVVYSDIRFINFPVPNKEECDKLGITTEQGQWVRIVDSVDGYKNCHYLTRLDGSVDPGISHVRGIILSPDNRIVCRSVIYTPEKGMDQFDPQEHDTLTWHVAPEGTVIRLFCDNGEWYISTLRKIDAYQSSIHTKSFGELFDDVVRHKSDTGIDTSTLDPSHIYTFLMVHPKNRIIYTVDAYDIYLINVYDKTNDTYKNPSLYLTDSFVSHPRTLDLSTPEDLIAFVNTCNTYDSSGIIGIDSNNVARVKYVPQQYLEFKQMRGHNPSIAYRYLELWSKKEETSAYENFFDTHQEDITRMKGKITKLVSKIHSYYINRFIKKYYREMPKEEHVTLYTLHSIYKQTHTPITRNTVEKTLRDAPFHCLVRMIRRIQPPTEV